MNHPSKIIFKNYFWFTTIKVNCLLIFVLVVNIGLSQTQLANDSDGRSNKPSLKKKKNIALRSGNIDFKNKYFQGLRYIDTFERIDCFSENVVLSEKDTTYFFEFDFSKKSQPFYMSDHEVTNGEYREFVYWVRDSLAREKLFKRLNKETRAEWVRYVNFNSGKQDSDGMNYVFNWKKQIDYEDPEIKFLLSDMYIDEQYQFYRTNSIDTRLLFFDYIDDLDNHIRIHVYPDTNCWVREFKYEYFDPMKSNYFWNSAYDRYPLVGITYLQAEAYCHWRTMMYQRTAVQNDKGRIKTNLKFRLPTNTEWDGAAWNHKLPFNQNGYETNFDGYYQSNYGSAKLSSGLPQKDYRDDGNFLTGVVMSYEPNFNGLYCMYGNVAEWTDSKPKLGDFFFDYYWQKNDFFNENTNDVYITDPYTDSTYVVKKGSSEHLELINKRVDFYKVFPEDNLDQVMQKHLSINSIGDDFRPKVEALWRGKQPWSSLKSSEVIYSLDTGVLDGVVNGVEIYDILNGDYYYTDIDRLKVSYHLFSQNAQSLNRAINYGNNSYSDGSSSDCRLVKGGSWWDDAHYLILNNSQVLNPNLSSTRVGFRIAADATGETLNRIDKKMIKNQRAYLKKEF